VAVRVPNLASFSLLLSSVKPSRKPSKFDGFLDGFLVCYKSAFYLPTAQLIA
jgi:hypothetical protein